MVITTTASDPEEHLHSTFASRYVRATLPMFRMWHKSIPREAAYQIISDELMLDGNPRLNLASFVTTWMEPECDRLIMSSLNKNYVDMDEYPVTTELQVGGWVGQQAASPATTAPSTRGESEGRLLHNESRESSEYVDENTICVAAILGSTLTGEFEDVKLLNELLTKKNKETGWETPIHVDAASGGFIAPFVYPDLEWDFRLPLVKSINVSGHKYGLVYAGVGWVVWRSKDDLPEDLIFHINYLGSDQPTFTLNFSRGRQSADGYVNISSDFPSFLVHDGRSNQPIIEGGASQIIAQYYQFIRLGFEKNIMENCMENARVLKQGIEKMGRFEIVSKDVGVPLLAFALKDSSSGHTVFEISESLRKFGWIVPAYTMPPDAQHVAVLRVVIREEFSHSLAERLISDIEQVLKEMDASPGRVSVQEKQKVGAHSVQKIARETEEEVTRQWRRFVDGRKTSGVC
ncbi:hypothetical protein RJ639_016847 [Escallonia herrerae]|uniref:glutamate decarboxylase n=1 Tax=Escallonia herrerae TaxID=1293975 RepID=A0AA88VBN6_9ASTE|nr:hypothetical protein RJ639_016847 [Escallonia herrerae]